jgi:hypothetical protein
MVNNSTNINKTTITFQIKAVNTKKTTTSDVRNPGPGLGPEQRSVAGLN